MHNYLKSSILRIVYGLPNTGFCYWFWKLCLLCYCHSHPSYTWMLLTAKSLLFPSWDQCRQNTWVLWAFPKLCLCLGPDLQKGWQGLWCSHAPYTQFSVNSSLVSTESLSKVFEVRAKPSLAPSNVKDSSSPRVPAILFFGIWVPVALLDLPNFMWLFKCIFEQKEAFQSKSKMVTTCISRSISPACTGCWFWLPWVKIPYPTMWSCSVLM